MTSRFVRTAFAALLTFAAALSGALVLPTVPEAGAAAGDCPTARIWVNTAANGSGPNQLIRYLPNGTPVGPNIPLTRAYGDIAWGNNGTTLYAAWQNTSGFLVTLDPTTGAETSTVTINYNGNPVTTVALSATPSGTLLLGGGRNIYELTPATGNTTLIATLPTGVSVGGDFLRLPDGDVLVLAQVAGTGAYYRLKSDGSLIQVGTGPIAFGGAQAGGEIFAATQAGDLIRIDDVPAGPSTAPLPTTTMVDTPLVFNGAASPQDNGSCGVDAFQAYGVEKTASLAQATPGDTVSYTIGIKNLGTVDYAAGTADVADDLSGVLDDADLVPGSITASSGTATVTGNTLTWTGALPVGATVTVTYQAVIHNPPTGSWELDNAVRGLGAQATCIKVCATQTPIRVGGTAPGACPPATIWMNTTAGGAATNALFRYGLDGTQIGGSIPLAAPYVDIAWSADGNTLYGMRTPNVLDEINYTAGGTIRSRTVSGLPGGGAVLGNALVALPDNTLLIDYGVNPNKSIYRVTITGLTTATASLVSPTPVPAPNTLIADMVPMPGGDVVAFAKNGASPTTTAVFRLSPAGAWTQVGTVPGAVFGAARMAGDVYITNTAAVVSRLSGVPTSASTAAIPVTQVFDAPMTQVAGASSVQDNMSPSDPCHKESDMSYSVAKSAPSSVNAGGLTTYTVTVTNTGGVPYPANYAGFRDDLTNVLDDGTLVPGSITASAGSVTTSGNTLSWSGPLAASGPGATVTVTYQVRAAFPQAGGNRSLINSVTFTGVGGTCASAAACTTTTSIRSFAVRKSATAGPVRPGAPVTYTVTVTNTDAGAWGPGEATFSDDLSDVLDDASIDPATIQATAGTATLTGTTLSWSGPLTVGGTAQITYVAVADDQPTDGGALVNTVAPGTGGTCPTTADCTTTTTIKRFGVTKTVAPVGPAAAGDPVTYTITVTNTGSAPWGPGEATLSDDLSDVLDDATIDPATIQATAGTATLTGTTLNWSGPLTVSGPDDVVTITYVAVVKDVPTNGTLLNTVDPGTDGRCPTTADCTTTTATKLFGVTKTVAPTGPAAPGDDVTYTITVTNPGSEPWGAGEATFSDNLSDVLDDATIDPATIQATAGTATLTGTTLNWSGPLSATGPGDTVTITYVASIRPGPAQGNDNLVNTVAAPQGSSCGPCRTVTSLVRAPAPPTQQPQHPPVPGALPDTGTPVTWWTLPLALALLLLGATAVWGARRRS